MSAAVGALVLTLSALCGSTVVSGILSTPTSVNLTSYNMNLVLKWSPPAGAPSSTVYTAEFKTIVTSAYRVGCVNITTLECDFTHPNISSHLPILEYGNYSGRVRAQLGSESSAWVGSNHISLDQDTIIGSPNVSLVSSGASIEVSITDPVFTVSAFRSVYHYATYSITYWKDSEEEKVTHLDDIEQNRVVLNDLDPWTKYCVRVQIKTTVNNRASKPSTPICEKTTNDEELPWVAAVVTFVFMAVGVALVVVGLVYRKRISHFFCPKDALPQHFKEYLLAPPNSTLYLAMRNSYPPKEMYHLVSIIADSSVVEEGGPLEVTQTTCSTQPVTVGGEVTSSNDSKDTDDTEGQLNTLSRPDFKLVMQQTAQLSRSRLP